jgi:hypothetical protein
VTLSCAERAGEFGMSIGAELQEIERKSAVDCIEFPCGDTLRTDEALIGLALDEVMQILLLFHRVPT